MAQISAQNAFINVKTMEIKEGLVLIKHYRYWTEIVEGDYLYVTKFKFWLNFAPNASVLSYIVTLFNELGDVCCFILRKENRVAHEIISFAISYLIVHN